MKTNWSPEGADPVRLLERHPSAKEHVTPGGLEDSTGLGSKDQSQAQTLTLPVLTPLEELPDPTVSLHLCPGPKCL